MIAKITDVFSSATRSPAAGVNALRRWFPRPSDRIELKQDLFGITAFTMPISKTWPTADPERLQLLLSLPPGTVALGDYQVGERLATWAKRAPVDAAVAVAASDVATWSESDVNELAIGITTGFDIDWVAKLIGKLPLLAPTLLVERPDVLTNPNVWTEVDHGVLISLVAHVEPDLQRATYIALISSGLSGVVDELLKLQPSLWWSIVAPDHAGHVSHDQLAIAEPRRLAVAVTSKRGPCPWPLTVVSQASVIALVTVPDEGIWRTISADLWVRTYNDELEPAAHDPYRTVSCDVMALGAAQATDQLAKRKRLWSLAFPRLHRSLLANGAQKGCERTLAALLPDGPSWDWCRRLRIALARTAVADGWSDDDLGRIALGAGDFAPEVIEAAQRLRHNKNRSVIDEVLDILTGWWR